MYSSGQLASYTTAVIVDSESLAFIADAAIDTALAVGTLRASISEWSIRGAYA
jgi:hypothetical protein